MAEITDDLSNVGPLSELLFVRLRRVDLLLGQAFSQVERRSEVVVSLAVIVSNPGISQNELARLIRIDASTVVGIVNSLEERGWAVRRPSEADRRRHALHATPEGEVSLDRMAAEIKQAERALLSSVDPMEVQYLGFLLEKIHASCTKAARDGETGGQSATYPGDACRG